MKLSARNQLPGTVRSIKQGTVMAEVEVAVTHRSPEHREREVFLPDERVSLGDALAWFTVGSAWVSHLERETGTVEVGKAADLVVLDRDIFAPDAGHLGEGRVLLTLVEGETVHEDRELEG